jgi:hypothetical protein
VTTNFPTPDQVSTTKGMDIAPVMGTALRAFAHPTQILNSIIVAA